MKFPELLGKRNLIKMSSDLEQISISVPSVESRIMTEEITYSASGVDIDAADEAIRRIGPHLRSTFRPEVLSDIGGFGSVVAIPEGYNEPILVSGNDGAGTKTLVAMALNSYETIGIDVVAMCVDDIATSGAEPLFFLDQITIGCS